MGPVRYSVVTARRTMSGITHEGWIVERCHGAYTSHVSVLFPTEAEAKEACERLEKLEKMSLRLKDLDAGRP